MPYFISGIFFQPSCDLGLATLPREGTVVVVDETLRQYFFAGFLQMDRRCVLNRLTGWIRDAFGEATITNISLGEDTLEFDKEYKDGSNIIRYRFQKLSDGTWTGTYKASPTGTGAARCVLTFVPDSFFDAQEAERLAGLAFLFKWNG